MASALDSTTVVLLSKSSKSSSVSGQDASAVSSALFPSITYTPADNQEITKWSKDLSSVESTAITTALNSHLSSRSTVLGTKPSVADYVVYAHFAPLVKSWDAEKRTGKEGFHHIVRFVDYVQNAENIYGLGLKEEDKVAINPDDVKYVIPPVDAKAEKEKKKKEAAAAAAAAGVAGASGAAAAAAQPAGSVGPIEAAKENIKGKAKEVKEKVKDAAAEVTGGKKEKKEKKPKAAPVPVKEKPLSPSMIDLRVGHILKAIQHPNADSLYVSTIAVGDPAGTDNTSEYEGQVVRTVCSGLNGLVPLEEMQGRKIVAVCNLKPVTMRGVKSCAMVLAASPKEEGDGHKGPVELVNPPAASQAGERVFFEGWEGEPEGVLNPKKKIWETLQPGFETTDGLEVGFNADAVEALKESGKTGVGILKTKEGICTVKTLKGATVR
jgi:aminoacyl tRNA synthase complex-interacting multifunctional protein 1